MIFLATQSGPFLLSNQYRSHTDKLARKSLDTVHQDGGQFKYWAPAAVLDVLESWQVTKNGCLPDAGLRDLQEECAVRAVHFNDVTCISIGLSGVARTDGTLFETSLSALVEQWLGARIPLSVASATTYGYSLADASSEMPAAAVHGVLTADNCADGGCGVAGASVSIIWS